MTSRKHLDRRKARRAQYELDPDIKAYIKDLSMELGVSQSQLVQYSLMLLMAKRSIREFPLKTYLEPSEAPMWQYRINFSELKRDLGLDE